MACLVARNHHHITTLKVKLRERGRGGEQGGHEISKANLK